MNETLSSIVADLFARSQGSEEITTHIGRLRTEINKGTDQADAVYGKFRGLLESFREVIPDEKQRYHAAIKALSTTSKLSQKEIVKAIGGQLAELKILEKSLLSPLSSWRDELKAMDAKAKLKSDEIAKLREQMARLETEEEGIRKGKAARERIMDLAEMAVKELFTDIGTEITSIRQKVEEVTAEGAAPQPAPQAAPVISEPVVEKKEDDQKIEIKAAPAPERSEFEKKCPMCGGRMNLHTAENLWMCYSCAYEEKNTAPAGFSQKSEVREPSTAPQQTGQQKQCPMCGGKMDYLSNERMWQCYSCAYEEDDKGDVPGKGSESGDMTPTFAGPALDPVMDAYEEPKKKAATKTKPCPSCKKKMYWYPEERAWRCHSCYYETRSLA